MPAQITSSLNRLVGAIREFTIAQRTIALIGVAVLVLGIAALALWVTRPAFAPLYSGLAPVDASAIVEQLQSEGVAYELGNGGTTVLVPEAQVYDQRLKAAAAGLPTAGGGGYSLLDDMGMTSSQFQQSVTYKRALEGELAQTIAALDGVTAASVRLAIPEETVFVAEKSDPTASVFVETRRGAALGPGQVEAIVHLTSASIDGLAPENVAVVAADGTVLSAVGVGATGGTDKQAADYESRVRGAVQAMLDTVVGVGKASVAVAAEMSYESAERIEEVFTQPEDRPALNESTSTETYTGGGAGATGVLGPDNIAVPGDGGGDGTFDSESTTRVNAVNKVTESRQIPAGAITRQTVSVAIDAAAATGLDVAEVERLVAAAAGLDVERGDVIAVELVPFSTAGAEQAAAEIGAAKAAAEQEALWSLIRAGVIAFGLVLAAAILGMLAVRARRGRDRALEDIGVLTAALESPVPEPPAIENPPTVPMALAVTPRDLEPAGADLMRAEVNALALADPERTAEYLRSLMEERQGA